MLPEIRKLLNADRILVQNTNNARMIEQLGFDPKNISVVYGAVDRKFYFPQSASTLKQELFVLIVGDCKPRKNPKLIERVIDFMPDVKFIIHGKNWQAYTTLGSVPRKNVQILDFQLARNPTLMRTASTVLSLAENEGGPFPLLEALASGTPIVATDTGFSADLISNLNGVLLSHFYSACDVFVCPSMQDNLPNTVLEALACNIPVVGFHVGGLPDLVTSELQGILASIDGGAAALAAATNSRIQSSSRARNERIPFFHSLESQARNYLRLYGNLINRSEIDNG
jgi:glycosyltransferase involved in cell wall biosynthesis